MFENALHFDSFEIGENEKKIRILTLEDEISGLFSARTGETSSKRSISLGDSAGNNENEAYKSEK